MKEHNCVRNSVGVFDVSHMGEILVEGENAEIFLQYCCSNDLKKLFVAGHNTIIFKLKWRYY